MRRGAAAMLIACCAASAAPVHAQPRRTVTLKLPEDIEVPQGGASILSIGLVLDRGITVSKDGPVIVDLALPAGVTTKRRRFGRAEAVDPGADAPRFAVPLKADTSRGAPIAGTVEVRVRLWACGHRVCKPLDLHGSIPLLGKVPERT